MIKLLGRTQRGAMALVLAGATVAAACGGGDEDPADTDAGQVNEDASTTEEPDAAVGHEDAGAADDGGTTQEQQPVTTPKDAGSDATAAATKAPTLTSAQFRQVGRSGEDARIDVLGLAGSSSVLAVKLQVVDQAGETVPVVDLDGDNKLDAVAFELPLVMPMAGKTTASYVELPKLLTQSASLHHVLVTLVGEDLETSGELNAPFEVQGVLAQGEACDASYVQNRCGAELGCKGAPMATCKPGEAPSVARVVYFNDAEEGPRVLFTGTDVDGDAKSFRLEFFSDTMGKTPVSIDLGGGAGEANSMSSALDDGASGGDVFVRLDVSADFAMLVKSVGVVLKDAGGRESGVPKVAAISTPQRVTSGGTCDIRGFQACLTGLVCTAGAMPPAGKCQALTTARTNACHDALLLDPANGVTSVRAQVAYPSLWNAPAGCSTNDPKGRPETLVKLVLAEPAAKVVLSTDHPFTSMDTTLYAMNACNADPALAWCADDQPAGVDAPQRAVLTLRNLDKGEHFVVVDSFPSMLRGAAFELSVEVQ
jgi:hypothetical protein